MTEKINLSAEDKQFLVELLSKYDGALTAESQDKMLEKFGKDLADQLTKNWEGKIGRLEKIFTEKDLDKPKGAFKNFADYVTSVKNYQTVENQNKLKTLETGVQGDFLIPVEYSAGLLDFSTQANPFMQMATKYPLKGNSFSLKYFKNKNQTSANFYGGVVSYWVEEGNAPTASDMQFGKIDFRLHDLALLIAATNDMIEDAPEAVSGMVNKAFAERIAYDLEDKFLNGLGAGCPLGILNSGAKVTQAKKTSQVAATIVSENLISMRNRLPQQSKANAIWIYASDAAVAVQSCKIGESDSPAFIPAGAMSLNQTLDLILGRPAYESQHISVALGTVNDIILTDPTQYGVAYKGTFTPTVESSAHLYFDSNKTAFRLVYRVDGQPLWDTYMTPAQGSITKSPIVVLATRS
uniref:Putative capsid protein n=1 Tax=viral metagenome TaxID=1070528 RepID=A0A6H1ZVP3_9ZZZZ